MMEMNSQYPEVSVLMPAYKSGTLILESIKSVINQTYQNWELIIIDDGSPDNTFNIIDGLAKQESRIKLFRQENQGIAGTRNNGFNYSSGNWIAYLDHDDLWHPRKLEAQITASLSDLKIDVVYSGGWTFYRDNLDDLTVHRTIYGTYKSDVMYLRQLEENYIATLSIMIKRALIVEIGPWDDRKKIQGCDDYDYLFRMARAGATFHGVNEHLFYYRKHDSNYSNDLVKMFVAESYVLIKNYDPQILDSRAKLRKFEKKVHSLILSLIRLGEVERTIDVLHELRLLLPSVYLNLSLIALKKFKTNALTIVRCLFKVQRVIN